MGRADNLTVRYPVPRHRGNDRLLGAGSGPSAALPLLEISTDIPRRGALHPDPLRRRSTSHLPCVEVLLLVIVLSAASRAFAQAEPESLDAEAPTLAYATDSTRPYYSVAASADVVQPIIGRYTLTLDVSLSRYHALEFAPTITTHGSYELSLGYRLWPFGDGLKWVYLGPSFALMARDDSFRVGASIEGGCQFVWQGFVATLGSGAKHDFSKSMGDGWSVVLRAAIGYAWM